MCGERVRMCGCVCVCARACACVQASHHLQDVLVDGGLQGLHGGLRGGLGRGWLVGDLLRQLQQLLDDVGHALLTDLRPRRRRLARRLCFLLEETRGW